MTSKKRFGVSVPRELADKLDAIATFSRRDRSSVVAKALEELVHEELHYGDEHACSGILVLMGRTSPSESEIGELAKIVKASITVRLNGIPVTVLFVEGSYRAIMDLRGTTARKSEFSRYIPLYCLYKRRKASAGQV